MSDNTIWVRTAPSPDGKTYVVSVELDEDTAITLPPDRAFVYAHVVLDAAARAEYDAAVFAQLMKITGKQELAGQMLADLRLDRVDLDEEATAPLRLVPGVSAFTSEPFIALHQTVKGKNGMVRQVGQWSVQDTREHASYVLEAVAAADLDAAYYRMLKGTIRLDEERARATVADVGRWRPRRES